MHLLLCKPVLLFGGLGVQDGLVWLVRVRMQHAEDSPAFRIVAKVRCILCISSALNSLIFFFLYINLAVTLRLVMIFVTTIQICVETNLIKYR